MTQMTAVIWRTWGGNFEPSRLKVARQLSGVTRKSLADIVDMSAASITLYENGTKAPTEQTMIRVANCLGFPLDFFYGHQLDVIDADGVTFRSRRSMTSSLRERAVAHSVIATDIISPALREKFRLPEPDIPDLSEHSPERAAELLRSHWRLGAGPISNMVHLLESRGVEVYWVNEKSDSVSAFSRRKNDRPYVFLNRNSQSGERGRFDAAHELAHLTRDRNERDLESRVVEAQADQFAAAFLMPPRQFAVESPRTPVLPNYFALKRRWGVSIAAMVRRSRDVGCISDWQYECACKEIAVNGWRKLEPHMLLRETSKAHETMLSLLERKGVGPEMFARENAIPLRELELLIPVAGQYHDRFELGMDAVDVDNDLSLERLRLVEIEKTWPSQ